MKPTEPKAERSVQWAVVYYWDAGHVTYEYVNASKAGAEAQCDACIEEHGGDWRVIPVTITPGHEAEDD